MSDAASAGGPGTPTATQVVRRAGLAAAWGTAVLQGRCAPDDAAAAIVGVDEPHRITGIDPDPVGWTVALGRLRGRGATVLVMVAPVPGDVAALPGPPELNRQALAAGAAVFADGSPAAGLVPRIDTFGPAGDRGVLLTWAAESANGPVAAGRRPTVGEADRALAEALDQGLRRLATLDVARWRPEAATLHDDLDGPVGIRLPPGFPERAVRLLARTQRMTAVLDLGRTDSGGAVTSAEAAQRQVTLDGLARVVRHAQAAAWNAGAEAGR